MTDCARCSHHLANVEHVGDNRCAADVRLGLSPAYARTSWMRSPAAPCGPKAKLFTVREGASISGGVRNGGSKDAQAHGEGPGGSAGMLQLHPA